MEKEPVKLSEKEIKSVESILTKGYRVEIMKSKDGVSVAEIRRTVVKTNK